MEEHVIIIDGEPIVVSFSVAMPIGVIDRFIDLDDTPEDYDGSAGLLPRVKPLEDGLEFVQLGINDLDPKSHGDLDDLEDDHHPLYLRHDGQREITGTLLPATDGTLALGRDDRHFNVGYFRQIRNESGRLDIYQRQPATEGTALLDIWAGAADGGQLLLRARQGVGGLGNIRLIPDTSVDVEGDMTMKNDKTFDWRTGKAKPRLYEGAVEPAIPADTWAMWYKTDTDQYFLMFRHNGTHKVELDVKT